MFATPPIPHSPTRGASERFLLAAIAVSPLVKRLHSESIDPRIDDLFHLMVVPSIGFFDRCTACIEHIRKKRDEM